MTEPNNFEEEKLARELAGLLARRGEWGAINRIKQIGQDLAAQGPDRLAKMAERVRAVGGNVRELDLYWNGLGK